MTTFEAVIAIAISIFAVGLMVCMTLSLIGDYRDSRVLKRTRKENELREHLDNLALDEVHRLFHTWFGAWKQKEVRNEEDKTL